MDDRPKRLLIVDDDEDYRVLVKTFIQVGMGNQAVVDEAASMAEAWARLDKHPYDLCLFDYRLGKENGLTLLKEVRAKGIETPVIFLTGQGDERTAVEAMKAGATDYLIKSKLRAGVLSTAIRHAITIHEKEQQRWLAEEALRIKTEQLQAVTGAMTVFLESGQWEDATVRLLRAALTQTQSETGFAGVMLEGQVLRILASEGPALECLAGREEYEKATKRDPEGGHVELTTFDHLLGELVSSGDVVLANDPAKSESGRGRGSGGQGLRNFLGVPVLRRGEVAGIFGVANRPGGFTEEDRARLDLLAQAAGVLFDSYRRRRREAELERYLRQADKLASLGTLLGGVAHELNNPLFMISGYAQLAVQKVKEGLYDGLTSDLAAIHDATNRASTIVERSLGAARSTLPRRVACQVNGVIQKTLQLVANDCLIHQIEVQTDLQQDLPPISADSDALGQVFLNLVNNATQQMFGAHGRGTLSVTSAIKKAGGKRKDSGEAWIEVRVTDDGPGIAPEHLPRIFEPFFTTKLVGEGTGLGLSICHRIVIEHGGTIACESTLGRGATFTVRLPALEEVKK